MNTVSEQPDWLRWVAEVFTEDPEPRQALVARTLESILAFETLHTNGRNAHDPVPAWLSAALERIGQRLSTFSPPDATLAWRYLIATRQLACAQEVAWREALNRSGAGPGCPLAPEEASSPTRHRVRPLREPAAVAGLGEVLAGYWLPVEGRRLVVEAMSAGLDWCRPEAFVRQLTMRLADNRRDFTPVDTGRPLAATASSAPDAVERTAPPAETTGEHGERSTPPTATVLHETLVDSVRHLCAEYRCNTNGARVWVTRESVWVVARQLAERMAAHPALQAHPHLLKQRAVLYRALVSHGLVLPNGAKPVWKVVLSFGEQRQRADVLKLRVDSIWPDARERPCGVDPDRVKVEESAAKNRAVD